MMSIKVMKGIDSSCWVNPFTRYSWHDGFLLHITELGLLEEINLCCGAVVSLVPVYISLLIITGLQILIKCLHHIVAMTVYWLPKRWWSLTSWPDHLGNGNLELSFVSQWIDVSGVMASENGPLMLCFGQLYCVVRAGIEQTVVVESLSVLCSFINSKHSHSVLINNRRMLNWIQCLQISSMCWNASFVGQLLINI